MEPRKHYFEVEIMTLYMNKTEYKYKIFLSEVNALKFVCANRENKLTEQGWCTTGKIEKKLFSDFE